jgi:hypothetical protein
MNVLQKSDQQMSSDLKEWMDSSREVLYVAMGSAVGLTEVQVQQLV